MEEPQQIHQNPPSIIHNPKKIEKTQDEVIKNSFCEDCNIEVAIKLKHLHNRTNEHIVNATKNLSENINILETSFNNRIATYEYLNLKNNLFPEKFLDEVKQPLLKLLEIKLAEHIAIKFNIELIAEYVKPALEAATRVIDVPSTSAKNNDSNICLKNQNKMFTHISKMTLATFATDLGDLFDVHSDKIKNKMSEFQEKDSGWALQKILRLKININKVALTKGSQYIKSPPKLALNRACINMQNNDNYCFKWCLVAALDVEPLINKSLTSSYNVNITEDDITLQNGVKLNFKGLKFPLVLKDVNKFEDINADISVNVFGFEGNEVVGPYYLTKKEKRIHVNLLLLQKEGNYHYIWIKNMSR